MKIIFEKNELLGAVLPMLGVVSAKNTIAAIEGIKVATEDGGCMLSAFDNEKGMVTHVSCEVIESGEYIIGASKLSQILRVLPDGKVTIEVNERNVAKISSGISSFELHALPGSDFPVLPELRGDKEFTIGQAELRDMINKVMFAVAVNDPKPMLNGVYFVIDGDTVTAVSCDSQRLALRRRRCSLESSYDGEMSFILPGKSLTELLKLLDTGEDSSVCIMIARKHIIFNFENKVFFTRMIDSNYIEYERFIPKTNRIFVKAPVDPLLRGLERASLVTEEKTMGQTKIPLRCTFTEGKLALSSVSVSGRFYDEIPVEKDGDDIEIGFNCRYFIDAMKCVDTDEVMLSMSTPLMSMVIEPSEKNEDDTFIYLVLPVRMKD